jgi:hypothetical protein
MRQHVLYAYAEGNDFAPVAEKLAARFADFIKGRQWVSGDAWPVNQRRQGGVGDWELGMNLELPNAHEEPTGWFVDSEEVAVFLRELAAEFGLEFTIGIGDKSRGIAEDLFWVNAGPIDIERLQAIIGVAPK